MQPSIRQLRAFVLLAEERHFTRARMLAEITALYREAAGFPAPSVRSV